jgi:hypothetical protein
MVVDHLKCYRIKDPNKLRGVVDLTSPQFGVEPGCRISKTRKFCVPVMKAVVSATVNGGPVGPSVSGQNLIDDYVCYNIICGTPPPASAKVQDQFSTRTFTKFKATEVCVPARKVP